MDQKYNSIRFTKILLLVFTIILSTAFFDQSIIFGQGQETKKQEPQSIPIVTEPQVFKVLSKSNTTTDLDTKSRDRDSCITTNDDKSRTKNSNQSIVEKGYDAYDHCFYICMQEQPIYSLCHERCFPLTLKPE